MDEKETRAGQLDLIGGALCLDFANTVGEHGADHPEEYLTSYDELVGWAQHVGIFDRAAGERLLQEANYRPKQAADVLARAVALREAIYNIFAALNVAAQPEQHDLATLNAELGRGLAFARVVPTAQGFGWVWAEEPALDRMLWPVARSAADLLTSDDVNRVRECAGDTCGWLFMDTSRNHSRQWCDMKSCGNRAKARRHYARSRTSTKEPGNAPTPG